MYLILEKTRLNPTVTKMVLSAPRVSRRAQAGQFVILRGTERSERIPLTIADYDREQGTITVIFQVVGAGTMELDGLRAGEYIQDVAGPLGRPSELEGLHKVCVVGGGVGCAIALPVAKALYQQGTQVHTIVGFRSEELVILEQEFAAWSHNMIRMSDDGSWGRQGLVTQALEEQIIAGEGYDRVIAIGPLPMMKFVSAVAKKHDVPVVVSMNSTMVDGTGMCGGCRLTVGGETRFACVDGPEFDGALVDFDEAIRRSGMYRAFETHAREEHCRLFGGRG